MRNTLKFNDADLIANREGRLSEKQQRELDAEIRRLQKDRKSMRGLMGIVLMMIVLAGVIIVLHDAGQGLPAPRIFADLMVYALVGITFIVLMGLVNWRGASRLHHLRTMQICIVDGTAEVSSTFRTIRVGRRWPEPGLRVPLYQLKLHRPGYYTPFTFTFSDKGALHRFKDGHRYRVYYLPFLSPHALSADEFEPEKAKR